MVENFENVDSREIHLPTLKEEYLFLKNVSAASLQSVQRNFFETKKQFFDETFRVNKNPH